MPIYDPSPAAAPIEGGFSELCGYFLVRRGQLRVGSVSLEDGVYRATARWRKAGVAVADAPLPG